MAQTSLGSNFGPNAVYEKSFSFFLFFQKCVLIAKIESLNNLRHIPVINSSGDAFCVELWLKQVWDRILVPMSYISFLELVTWIGEARRGDGGSPRRLARRPRETKAACKFLKKTPQKALNHDLTLPSFRSRREDAEIFRIF